MTVLSPAPLSPVRRYARVLLGAALLLAASPVAHASAALPERLAALFPTPVALFEAEPDVVLQRAPGGLSVQIITAGQITPKVLARRYGVTTGAVRTLKSASDWRLSEIRLPGRAAVRAPARPSSVHSYAARPGDTLSAVATRHGLSMVDLLGVNLDRQSLDTLRAGETLNIPTRERGLLVRIKPGQSALSLIAGYGADLVATAHANDVLPTELQVGDELLLPGVRAEGFRLQLLAAREAERQAQLAYEKQQRYEAYLTWKKDRDRQRLQEKYARQQKYEAYLAWKDSPERRRQQAAYERQAQYEAAQAAARQRAATAAVRPQANLPATVQTASTGRVGGLAWPLRSFTLTSRFGERDIAFHREVFHGGIDLAAPFGTPIYAASGGTVSASGYGAFGLNVLTVSGNSTVIYGHMSRTAVVAGQTVQPGQLLGYIGCTGICTGPHLHFEVRLGGQAIDPFAMLP
ncbi:peptidase M23 [Deinococcus aerolatus]|uniref:Peptidase M23 n=1 Tax=Deinococcus aerolatus TaxID=522487 RepID=A0ABQ2G2J9_9DEIO|nr:peptidase M23 [Deinococcus aerolatus]